MKAPLIVSFVLLASTALAQPPPPPPPPMPPGGHAVGGRDGRDDRDDRDGWRHRDRDRRGPPVVVSRPEMTEQLSEAQKLISEAMGRAKKDKRLYALLVRARTELDRAQADLGAAPTPRELDESQRRAFGFMSDVMGMGRDQIEADRRERERDGRVREVVVVTKEVRPAEPPKPPEPARVFPMEEFAFRQLLAAVENEGFPQNKLQVIQQAAPSNWFLVNQVKAILSELPFPQTKIDAMRALKPRILDTENYFQLYSSFDFPNDKAELKKILGQ